MGGGGGGWGEGVPKTNEMKQFVYQVKVKLSSIVSKERKREEATKERVEWRGGEEMVRMVVNAYQDTITERQREKKRLRKGGG